MLKDCNIDGTIEHAKKIALVRALEDNDYNIQRTVSQLRIGRSTLYRLIDDYDLRPLIESHIKPAKLRLSAFPRTRPPARSRLEIVDGNIIMTLIN